jgi:3'-5' exoribonuclease
MRNKFVSQFKKGDLVDEVFLVNSVELRKTKTGNEYLRLEFADRTGSIVGNIWDNAEAYYRQIRSGSFAKVKGNVDEYQDRLQLKVRSVLDYDPKLVDMADFIPRSKFSTEQLMARLNELLGMLKTPHLVKLSKAFLDDREFMVAFTNAPAATKFHHAWIGGLLEHTVSAMTFTRDLLPDMPGVNGELLMLGAFLHDIGKAREYAYYPTLQVTDNGRLLGHMHLGVTMVREKAAAIQSFPPDTLVALEHMILSHHGQHEWGAPILPATMESVALHYVDNLDAKLAAFREALEACAGQDRRWTDRAMAFDNRMLFIPGGPAAAQSE